MSSANEMRATGGRSRFLPAVLLMAALSASCAAGPPPVAVLTVSPTEVSIGFPEVAPLQLSWEPRGPLEGATGAARVFVHVYSQAGKVLRTFDHPFPKPWREGERVEYEIEIHQSALGPPLAAGEYHVSVGLYDTSGRRWPLSTSGEEVSDREYQVARLRIDDGGGVPMFRFSEGWKPAVPGTDQQVLGRRWLASRGSIAVTGLTSVGTVRLRLLVPAPEPGERRLVVDPRFSETRVLVASTCGGGEIELTGVGVHEIDVPVFESAHEPTRECEIDFTPNFHLLSSGTTESRAVLLDQLSWRPGP